MDMPDVKIGEIIKIGNHFNAPKAQIVNIYNKEDKDTGIFGDVEVVYHQNRMKCIKEDVIWNEKEWKFKNDGPSGIYMNINDYPMLK